VQTFDTLKIEVVPQIMELRRKINFNFIEKIDTTSSSSGGQMKKLIDGDEEGG